MFRLEVLRVLAWPHRSYEVLIPRIFVVVRDLKIALHME
jgi:hypothetical protein